jgi:hypothetical protein
MRKRIFKSLVGCLAVSGLLLAGAAGAEASTITLIEGDSTADLCLPESPTVNSCGTTGLSNWIVNGNTSSFHQWFSIEVAASPAWGSTSEMSWSGSIDALSAPVVTHSTPSTASVSYANWNLAHWPDAAEPLGFGLKVDYALTGSGAGPSHLFETITLFNPTYYYYYVALTDGLGINVHNFYVYPYTDPILATADYTPNPEPVSMVLLGTGLLAVARARRRMGTIA